MPSALADKWSALDRLIQWLRFRQVVGRVSPGCVLVDIGCGDGAFLRWVEQSVREGIGFDANVDDRALSGKTRIVRLDASQRIPLPDGAADIVTALALVEHLESPRALIEEVHRILRPGGLFVLTTPAPRARPVLEFLAFRLNLISRADVADHKKYFSREELLSALRGFSSIEYRTFELGLNQLVVARRS